MIDTLGIKQIKIDLPFRLNHVYCFLAEGEDGWTVIDTGLHNNYTVNLWDKELNNKEIHNIIITHYHPDHFGYAGGLQEKTGAKVSMTKTDADLGYNAWTDGFINEIRRNYTLAGVPDETANKMKNNTEEFIHYVTPYPRVDHYLEEGEKVRIGHYEYEVIFTPGHSDGLVTFYNAKHNVLLGTDHILPKITPNISYWFHGEENPLQLYLESLEKIRALHADYVIPSHGKPFYGANERIDEIKEHHEERLAKLQTIIKKPCHVYEASQKLFEKELNVHETRFAVGETLAHLEYLRKKGDCGREMYNNSWIYYK
ncbi:MBL fold metallo-hydrolase [Alteribacillus sp. YIM 98480]|uniref:MBL fold metallo-hydrolase n=1 Tax=Alteribacillus sp. YIM 98480 TaxID=2606599 RepID=UPI00131DF611|nr:MBL fold metallo-hydrolase [Alteribacillus sp. YIM 98480]